MAIKFSGLKNIKGQVKVKNKNTNNNSIIQNPNVYSGSHDDTLRKIDSEGNEVWTFTGHTGRVVSEAVDASGNVYSGSADDTVKKLDSSGNLIWTFTGHFGAIWSRIAVDPGLYPIFWS